jgi:hypothetical protein
MEKCTPFMSKTMLLQSIMQEFEVKYAQKAKNNTLNILQIDFITPQSDTRVGRIWGIYGKAVLPNQNRASKNRLYYPKI